MATFQALSTKLLQANPIATVFSVGLLTLVLTVLTIIVRGALLHPLQGYPGPVLAKFSPFDTLAAVVRQDRTLHQFKLLREYGSPVRIGPNELLFSDLKAWNDIYGQSSQPCLKDPGAYDAFSVTGALNLLAVSERGRHARLRRLFSHGFSIKSLLQSEPLFAAKIKEYVEVVFNDKSHVPGEPIQIYRKTHELFLDIVSQLSFGQSFDCLSGHNQTALEDVNAFFTVIPAVAFAPVIRYLGLKRIREGFRGLARFEEFARHTISDYLLRSKVSGQTEKGRVEKAGSNKLLLDDLANAKDDETNTQLSQEELVENGMLFMTAGSGTTASTTLWLLWECGRRPQVRQRLAAEIRARFHDPQVMPTYAEASQLKYLNCVIDETLRLWGPLNVPAPRISPGKVIAGRYVPPGIVISINPYATTRDPQYYPDPEKFNPSRWLEATEEMRSMSRPFSLGPRNCIGKHVAEIGIYLTVARVYQLYDVVAHPSMTPKMMRPRDFGILEPWAQSLLVTVTGVHK